MTLTALFLSHLLGQDNSAAAIAIETLDLSVINQDWGEPRKGRSVEGKPLKIGGRTFTSGLGTHAGSSFLIELNGASSFTASVGVDDETDGKGSVRFRVYLDGKLVAETTPMKGGGKPQKVDVNLKGAKRMRLVVDDAGDGIDHDHADWAEAVIVGGKPRGVRDEALLEPVIPLAKPNLNKTELHGPRIVGGTPGRDFLFRIPATGRAPLTYSATGLPEGLTLDAKRGVIKGQIAKAGEYRVKLTVSGPGGKDSRALRIVGGKNKLALTPPMGWNSWNVWGLSVDADKVRAAADAFEKTGLAAHGYNFVNIDDAWEGKRNAQGVLETNEKFPDMRNLSDYVHRNGLKLGIYSSPGPLTCGQYAGSWQHEAIDAKTWAEWGIDYLKHDWCSYGNIAKDGSRAELMRPYFTMREALDAAGRDIVYSLCQYGMGDVHTWGNRVGADLWRTTGDITDTWSSMAGIGFSQANRSPYAGPSGWNDPDMLVVGHLGWGPSVRPSRLTPNEQVTHMTLWSLLAAPLLIGCDLTKIDDLTGSLLMNHDMIEINQDPLGKAAVVKAKDGDLEVWARPLWDGTMAVGLFNRGLERANVKVDWKTLGLKGGQPVRDVWSRKDLGAFASGYGASVPAHGAIFIRVGKIAE
ncbi:MAG: NPCBM/NEW2 domain-containing protein [Fimbriimonas sp.]